MGLHTGEAHERDGDYFGPAVIRTARLMALGHGGQVLVSGATARLLEESSDHASMLRPLGEVALRGLRRVEEVHELRYPGLDDEFPPLTVQLPRSRSLPNVTDELIGRDDAVAGAMTLLSGASLITLTGPGGVGKTRLSIEVGALADDRFGEGVWFVPLASVSDDSAVPSAVAEVLGVQETAGRSLTESIVGAIAARELMLILDNCEHVIAGARRFALALARDAAPVVLLATSREPLAIAGEHIVVVEPLSTDDSQAEMAPAAQLFIERAVRSDPGFSSVDSAEAIRAICARLDGMPLAIELAAARVRGLGLEGLGTHLDDRFRLLRDRGAVDSRHQTLLATVRWSFDLLDDRLRELFCRAGVFAGGFALDAAEDVLAFGDLDSLDVADGLAELVDKSMLQTEETPSGRRYRMLETMRQYGADTIDPTGLGSTRHRFVCHYADWCTAADRALSGPDAGHTLARLRAEFDNVREAVRLASAAGQLDDAATIVVTMHNFGLQTVNAEPFTWALELLELVPTGHARYGELLISATWGCRSRGDRRRAQELIAEFERLDAEGTIVPAPRSLFLLGNMYWFFRQTDSGLEVLKRAIADAHLAGDTWTEGHALAVLSMAQDSFDRSAAEQSARASVALGRAASAPLLIGNGLLALIGVVVHTEPERAVEIVDEMIDIARDAGDLWTEATGVRLKAHALSRAGDLAAASRIYIEAIDLNGVGDFGELIWYMVLNIAEHLTRVDNPAAAAVALGAFGAATAAPSDDLVARATERLRARIEQQLDGPSAELEATGASMRLAELLNQLRSHLINHADT